jgi:hypothetical protein
MFYFALDFKMFIGGILKRSIPNACILLILYLIKWGSLLK